MEIPQLETFNPFTKLPVELQLKIWSDALPGTQVVTVSHVPGYNRGRSRYHRGRALTQCKASSTHEFNQLLSMLHACHASRALALKRYTLTFHSQLKQPIFFDFDNDVLYLSDYETASAFFRHALKDPVAYSSQSSIQRLAVNGGEKFVTACELPELKSLRDLYLSEYSIRSKTRMKMSSKLSQPRTSEVMYSLLGREWRLSIVGMEPLNRIQEEGTKELPRLVLASLSELDDLVKSSTWKEWCLRGSVWSPGL